MKLAVVGATGLVGQEILQVLDERNFEFSELLPVASQKSVGKTITFKGKDYTVIGMEEAVSLKSDIAIFSAGGSTSLEWAPKFEEVGSIVIDNSSAWRMSPKHKLIIPEINASVLNIDDRIIANPNCSTIQMVLALAPLHTRYKIRRIVVSTYQSVTGTGKNAVEQMMNERAGKDGVMVYPHKIDMNALPHIDVFLDNGYTKEEMKMVWETKKILGDDNVLVNPTAVRVPVFFGHGESLHIETNSPISAEAVKDLLEQAPGIVVCRNDEDFPTQIGDASGKDDTYVGRIREDISHHSGINMWIVADNVRKGAATNSVQIAELLVKDHLS